MKITLKRETFLKKAVEMAQSKSGRYFALGVFVLVTLVQSFVGYSFWEVLVVRLAVEVRFVIGLIVGYVLVCLFYLLIFYGVMVCVMHECMWVMVLMCGVDPG